MHLPQYSFLLVADYVVLLTVSFANNANTSCDKMDLLLFLLFIHCPVVSGPLTIMPTITLLGLQMFKGAAVYAAKQWWICAL